MDTLVRRRMSYQDWLTLPEKPKAEWVDGEAVWSMSPPTFDHGVGQAQFCRLSLTALPGLKVATETVLRLPTNRVRLPDVSVVDHRPEGGMIEDPPVLVVEILSASTRGQDTVTKAHEYAVGGVGQYWLLDPDARMLDVYELVDGGWRPLLRLDESSPVNSVPVGEHGRVEPDLRILLDLDSSG